MPLTNEDKNWIVESVSSIFREEVGKFREQAQKRGSHLPTKVEFYDRSDQILDDGKKIDEKLNLINQRISTLEQEMDRLKQLVEKK